MNNNPHFYDYVSVMFGHERWNRKILRSSLWNLYRLQVLEIGRQRSARYPGAMLGRRTSRHQQYPAVCWLGLQSRHWNEFKWRLDSVDSWSFCQLGPRRAGRGQICHCSYNGVNALFITQTVTEREIFRRQMNFTSDLLAWKSSHRLHPRNIRTDFVVTEINVVYQLLAL